MRCLAPGTRAMPLQDSCTREPTDRSLRAEVTSLGFQIPGHCLRRLSPPWLPPACRWLGLGKLAHELCSSEDLNQRSQTHEGQTPDDGREDSHIETSGRRTNDSGDLCGEQYLGADLHHWKKEFGLLDVKQAKRLKELEAENTRLKRIAADQRPGMEIIQEALEKKL